ncbi:MAG: RNA methyltransferase [Leptospiraceae bacterium]|nr:RNA methyltransferase [Leptospiraceae bacterium]MCP5510315.1 RNA methyltransferase [Leptospiraceae bacterium]
MNLISDPNDPGLEEFRSLRTKKKSNTFIAESEKVCLRLLDSNLKIKSILLDQNNYKKHLSRISERVPEKNIYVAPGEVLESIVGYPLHQNLMILTEIPPFSDLQFDSNHYILLNGITDPENLGSIFRSGIAFGFQNFILDKTTSPPYNRRTVRVSMGNVFQSQLFVPVNVPLVLKEFQFRGFKVLITSPEQRPTLPSICLKDFVPPEKWVLVLGNEARGVSDELYPFADYSLFLPVRTDSDSINVSHAASIFFSHLSILK